MVRTILFGVILFFLISNCADTIDKRLNEKFGVTTGKIVREKSNELNRRATNYAHQKDKLILDYHTFIFGFKQSEGKASDSIDVYLDRTRGMSFMISALNQDNTWSDLLNSSLRGPKANWFEVHGLGTLPVNTPAFNNLIDVELKYYEIYGSPLDSAFIRIVRNKTRQSIFITDGELARIDEAFTGIKRETIINPKEAWAKEMIASWLMDGGVIDVLIRPYFRPYPANDTMRGFVFIFTPAYLVNDPGNIKNVILNNLRINNRGNLYHLRFGYYDHFMGRIEPIAGSVGEVINRNFTDKFGANSFRRVVNQEKRFEHIHFNLPVEDFRKFFYTWINMTQDRVTREPIESHKLFDNLGFVNNYLVFDSVRLGLWVYNFDLAIEDFILLKKTEWADTIQTEQYGTIYCIEHFDFPNERPDYSLPPLTTFDNCFSIGFHSSVNQAGHLYQKYSVNAFPPSTDFNFTDFSTANSFKIDFVIKEFPNNGGIGKNPLLNQLKWNNQSFSDPVNDGVLRSFLFAFTENQRFIKEKPVYTIYLTFN